MIKSLELTNFMSVTYAKHTFSSGLNVIRGANEAGKSTRFLAIAYALWGARALPSALEDTVTWGQPVSSLKVTLIFSLGDTIYTIIRTRAGAAMAGSDNSLSEGQAEVTAQVERLTGASAQIGMLTLLTHQGDLQSSLGSVSLIEKLSNTSLLDRIITAISEQFPSGNTKRLETELEKELIKPAELGNEEFLAVKTAQGSLYTAQRRVAEAKATLDELKPSVSAAVKLLSKRLDAERSIKELRNRLKPRLQEPLKPAEPRTLEELQQLKAAAEELERAKRAQSIFYTIPKDCKEGSLESYQTKFEEVTRTYRELKSKLQQLQAEEVKVKATGIWEESCTLCGKLLTDVPEVVQINSKVESALMKLKQETAEVTADLEKCHEEFYSLDALIRSAEVVIAKLPTLTDYCTIDYNYTPPLVQFTYDISEDTPVENYATLIAEFHANRMRYTKALAEVTAHNSQCDSIEKELAAITLPDTTEVEAIIATENRLRLAYDSEIASERLATQKLQDATHTLDKARAIHAAQMEAYNTAVASREQLQQLLKDSRENNALIAKIKAMKPAISKALWSIVLLSVSTVFSQLRGTPSVVTRDSDGFLIDGKKARNYSGSTKDILGLAIRITLQKTFLPNLFFCLLDEPAAAADATREEAMLAALSRVDFSQIILVTHSDLADTFAQSVHLL